MKQHSLIIAFVVAIVLLGGIGLLTNKKVVAPAPSGVATTSASEQEVVIEGSESVPEDTPTGAPSAPSNAQVIGYTVWAPFAPATWGISLMHQTTWDATPITDDKARMTGISISHPEGTMLVSKDKPIAEPARLTFTTSTRIVAGQEVEVHTYTKPNDQYAYYMYFTVAADSDLYYVSIKSTTESTKAVDGFISRIRVR